jgi:hypothetical protein
MLKAWEGVARCHFIRGFDQHEQYLLPFTKGTYEEKWMAAVEAHVRDGAGDGKGEGY